MDLSLGESLPRIEIDDGAIRLRAFDAGDLAIVEEASRDPHIPLITSIPADFTIAEGEAFIERQALRLTSGAGWPLVVEVDGRAVGQVGLFIGNLDSGRGEIGYWVVGSERGRGFAAQAVMALSRWAFEELDMLHRLSLFVEPWNAASIATAERAGFVAEAILREWELIDGEAKDMWVYALTRSAVGLSTY